MSRSDIRCLFCDGRLPLFRKITNGQFCSPAHRKAYWAEQERLALERLHQTHNSLRSYSASPETIEQILGQPAAPTESERVEFEQPAIHEELVAQELPVEQEAPVAQHVAVAEEVLQAPEPAGPIFVTIAPRFDLSPEMVSADPVEYETALTPYRPLWSPETPATGMDGCFAEAVTMRGTERALTQAMQPEVRGVTPLFPRVPDPVRLSMQAPPETEEFYRYFDEQIPPVAGRLAMLRFEPRNPAEIRPQGMSGVLEEAIAAPPKRGRGVRTKLRAGRGAVMQVRLPLEAEGVNVRLGELQVAMAGQVAMPTGTVAATYRLGLIQIAPAEIAPLELRSPSANVAQYTLSIPTAKMHLRLARGSRYRVNSKAAFVLASAVEPVDFPAVPPELSAARLAPVDTAPAREASRVLAQVSSALLSILHGPLEGREPGIPRPVSRFATIPQPVLLDVIKPTTSRLQPLDEKPASDHGSVAAVGLLGITDHGRKFKAHVWEHAANFWKTAPRDLKLLVVAIPVLLGLVLNPVLPKVKVNASSGGLQKNFQKAFDQQWGNVKQGLADRAAIALNEDFRSGLDDWASRDDATATWSFDPAGFVSPATLALYRPSLGLADYQFQFLGMIEKKAMSWVVRAVDYDNYYVVKLQVLKPGPLPTIGLTRYAVVNGKADSRVDTLVPINARADTLYRVLVDVNGSDFSVAVQGQMIDSWRETRLPRGGVGFYSSRGEESRVRWVQLTHQYDMLGRLCAFLAPYDPTTNGRF